MLFANARGGKNTVSKQKTKIILVDDHPLVREWLTNLIHQQPDLEVCGGAETAPDALRQIEKLKPDVAIIDISLKDGSGIELIKNIKAVDKRVEIVVLSMHDERLYAERALRAGARAYVMKRESTGNIIAAVRRVLAGELYVSDRMSAAFAQKFVGGKSPTDASPIDQLSDRELEVFQMLGEGIETRRIAESLNVSMKTVQVYCARIKEKLNLANATELLREAVRWHDSQTRS